MDDFLQDSCKRIDNNCTRESENTVHIGHRFSNNFNTVCVCVYIYIFVVVVVLG